MKHFLPLFLLSGFSAFAQVNPQWAARFNGKGDFNDKVNCITKDASGYLYLAGYSTRAGNEKDFLVMKLDPNGDTLWTRTFDGPNHGHDEAMAIAYDPTGNIYATGYAEGNGTNNDLFLVKLNLQGDSLWTRTYNYNLINQDEQGNAVAVDLNGNVVVTGQSDMDPSALVSDDYITLRFTPAGVQSWAIRYNGAGVGTDRAVAVAMLANGNAVVTGRSKNSDDDFVTKCYTPAGTTAWTAVFDGGAGKDRASAMTTDASGNIYITGHSENGNDYDYSVVKYNSSGVEQWRNFYDHLAGNDYATGIAVDANGRVIITGQCDTDPLLPVADNIVTVSYTPAGVQSWVGNYNGNGNGDEEAVAIVADENGKIFITGKTDVNASSSIVDNDIVTLCYTYAGTQLWAQTIGIAGGADGGAGLVLDLSGNCIVAGTITPGTSQKDIRRIEYTSGGTLVWQKDYNGSGDHSDVVNEMTSDASGNSYMCGYSYSPENKRDMCVVKVTSIGDTAWVRTVDGTANSDDEAVAVKVDGSGNVYITGYTKDTVTGNDYCTVKYNSAGVQQWLVKYNFSTGNGTDRAVAMAVNAAGEVFVTGESDGDPSSNTNYDITTLKYNTAGVQQWVMRYNGPGNFSDKPSCIRLSAAGDVYVAGKIAIAAHNDDAVVIKYSASGTQDWATSYTSAYGSDDAVAIDLDAVGDVAAAVRYKNAALNDDMAAWYLNTLGVWYWFVPYNGSGNGNDQPSGIAFDASGNIFMTGETDVDADTSIANYDIITIKYNSACVQQWVKTYSGAAGDDDKGVAVAVDNATGYAYVCGQSQEGTMANKNNNFILLQYDPAGNQQLIGTYDGAGGSDGPDNLSIEGNNIYTAGTSAGANNNQKDMVMLLFTTFNVGINNPGPVSGISVFPNPCSAFTEIHFADAAPREVSIVDMNGRGVLQLSASSEVLRLETTTLAKGVYAGTVTETGKAPEHFRLIVR